MGGDLERNRFLISSCPKPPSLQSFHKATYGVSRATKDADLVVIAKRSVIVTKLRWALIAGRGKDRDDVRDVIAVQGDVLDWSYIKGWARQHGTEPLLEEIQSQIPPP